MNAPQAFEVVATAAGLIEWLSDEIEAVTDDPDGDFDTIQSRNADIWRVANAIREAVNGSFTWEETERAIIAIRRRYDE